MKSIRYCQASPLYYYGLPPNIYYAFIMIVNLRFYGKQPRPHIPAKSHLSHRAAQGYPMWLRPIIAAIVIVNNSINVPSPKAKAEKDC